MYGLFNRPRPSTALAALAGSATAVMIVAVLTPFHNELTGAVPALALVVPIIATAALGERTAAFIVAAVASVAITFALPPIGSPQIELGEDILAFIVFGAVAFFVSALVTKRVSALERVDEQRRALLNCVSHDLRTPLSAIHAIATDFRSGATYDEATRDEVLDVLIDETERLDRLVGNLLSMSRIEAGTMTPRRAPLDLAELVVLSTRRVARLYRRRDLDVDVPPDLPLINADPAQIEQVLSNLLENAARHTPADTHLKVAARAVPAGVELVVVDDGPGVPLGARERLSSSISPTDAGVGLVICRSIVELHGGTFRLEDEDPGSRFVILLPCA